MVRKNIDISKGPTEEQIKMLEKAADMPIIYDEDSPCFTDEELKEFKRVSAINKENRKKQTVTIRLSPQALEKAKSLGKGYTSVLSRILEDALSDNEYLKQHL